MNVKEMLEEQGAVETVEDHGDGTFHVHLKIGGVLLLANHEPGESFSLYTSFSNLPISTEFANWWNQKHRFAVVYQDREGDFSLEATTPLWGDPDLYTVVTKSLDVFLSALKVSGEKAMGL